MSRLDRAAPILALIRKHESDGAVKAQGVPDAYSVVYGGIRKTNRPKENLTTYPVGEVLDWQEFVVKRGAASSAAGAYQIIRRTLLSLKIPEGRQFDAACQDEAALKLLDRRGWARCAAGKMTPEAFGNALAREWASLPLITGPYRGKSYYAGDGLNFASATPKEVMAAIHAALEAPVVPPGERTLEERVAALEAAVEALGGDIQFTGLRRMKPAAPRPL